MTTAWLTLVYDNEEPHTPALDDLADTLYERAHDQLLATVCPRWLRWDLTEIAWLGAPLAVAGLGLPSGLVRLYWATLLAIAVYASLRWNRIDATFHKIRRQRCMPIVRAVAEEMSTANPALAFDVAQGQTWSAGIEAAVVVSATQHLEQRRENERRW